MLYTTDTFLCFRCLYLQYHQEEAQTEFFASAFASTLPASQDCLDEYRTAQQEGNTGHQLITFCQQGWPYRPQLKGDLSSYWHVSSPSITTFSCATGVSLFPRACKPQLCRKMMHNGHQDIQRCCQCTISSVWWPGVSKHIEQLMKSCPNCAKASTLHKEPLMYSQIMHAWGNVGLDLFELNGNTYTDWLWTMSHASLKSRSYPSSNCRSVIPALNAIFSRHRGPGTLVSKDFCVPPPPPPPPRVMEWLRDQTNREEPIGGVQ